MRALLLFVAAAAIVALPDGGRAEDEGPVVPGQFLVRYKPGVEPSIAAADGSTTYNEALGVWRVDVGETSRSREIADDLRRDPAVESVQPQYHYERATEPDDPLYRSKQHVHFRTINVQAAWQATAASDDVTVAVIDGGVDVLHPDLDSRIWTNDAETANGLDDDSNGCVDDLTGCSFQSSPPNGSVQDQDGHGTFVAGLVAAERNNGEGVAGIASNARIMPVRALDSNGGGTTEQLAESILYAARNGADVLNLSLVLPPIGFVCPTDPIVGDALAEAATVHGASIIAAAGNFGIDCVGFPASSTYAVAVGGSGPAEDSDRHAPFSQWGPEVDVAAPAMGLVSTCPAPTPSPTYYCPGTPYGEGDGTSFAAPIVSGVAAMLLGADPSLSPSAVESTLRDTARVVPDENRPNWNGAGIVDAGAALDAGSAWSSLDLRGIDLAGASLRVVIGNVASPVCEARVWGSPDIAVKSVTSTAGVGECAQYWPPTTDSPWTLAARSSGDKSQVVNSWSLTAEGLSCSATSTPVTASVGTDALATIDCGSTGRVINDEPGAARDVPVGTLPRRYKQDVRYATSVGDPVTMCAAAVSRTAWYRFAPDAPMGITAGTAGTAFDTVLAIYRENGGALTQVACNDDFRGPQSRVTWTADGSSTYLVMAGAYGAVPAAAMQVDFSAAVLPLNDSEASAVALDPGAGAPLVQPSFNASADASDPDLGCTGIYGSSLWFTVTAPAGGTLTVTTAGSTYNTVLGVLDGVTEVACNNDAGPGNQTSAATWAAVPGRQYRVVVGSFLGRAGGTLRIAATGAP